MADNWTPEQEAAARRNAAGLNAFLTSQSGFGEGGANRAAFENIGSNISRNIGIENQLRKPDGTVIANNGFNSVAAFKGNVSLSSETKVFTPFGNFDLSNGSANFSSTPNVFNSPQVDVSPEGEDGATVDVESKEESQLSGVTVIGNYLRNPLEEFASYSVLWTLAVLTPEQFNNPGSYRDDASSLEYVVFSSAGRFGDKRVSTAFGTPEFFIQNFNMRCVVAASEKTGNQNAMGFSFEIFEPYSMGLLLQSLQRAARLAKYENYLDNTPYVLRMDIQGYDELGNILKSVNPKFFVLKLSGIKFSTNESGSTYKFEAIAFNHSAYADATNSAYKDCKIFGDPNGPGTVVELLKSGQNSLVNFLNRNEKNLKDKKLIDKEDVYDIQFPPHAGVMFSKAGSPPDNNKATFDPGESKDNPVDSAAAGREDAEQLVNVIGSSSLGFDQKDGGTVGFKRANEIYDEKTGIKKVDDMVFNPKERAFQFAQKTSITAIINQVICSSKWAQDTIKKKTAEGYIQWFRVDVQIELLDFDKLVGDYAKKIIFRVVPYYVHETIFAEPTYTPIGYSTLLNKVCKYYDYIYTGQNVDIIKFDIDINNLFFKGAQPAPPQETALGNNPDQNGTAANPKTVIERKAGDGEPEKQEEENVGRPRKKRDPAYLEKLAGGSGFRDSEQEIAEEFQQAFLSGSSADLIKVNLEILGDPYWIVDHGVCNYFSNAESPVSQVTADGTMNYQDGDIYCYLNFRTPADIDETTGLYDFNGTIKESPFGGIYRVNLVENTFAEGYWKQKLTLLRMPGPQGPEEGESKKVAEPGDQGTGYTEAGPEPETTTVGEDPTPTEPVDPTIQIA